MIVGLVSTSLISTPAAVRTRRVRRDYTLGALLLLTLIGGVLRFTALDLPKIWGDEALTYGRVAGSYQQMLDQLVNASFPPLHYEIEWWIGQGLPYWGSIKTVEVKLPDGQVELARQFEPTRRLVPGGIRLTPFALRFVPALAGTLFIPAIYFLSRQLFGRRVSILAATLACFSAYLLNYSRDAKMYMELWLAVTVHVGCLLWWLRVRRVTPWALWVLSGIAMVGLHATAFAVIGIDAVILLSSPRQRWTQWIMVGATLGWVVSFPVIYWIERRRRKREPEVTQPPARWIRFRRFAYDAYRPALFLPLAGFAIGIALQIFTAFGPLGFYSTFNDNYQHITAEDRPLGLRIRDIGIGWVSAYNQGRSFSNYLLYTTSAYLSAWEWPRDAVEQARIVPRTFDLLRAGVIALLALLGLGLFPWRKIFAPARARLERMTQNAPLERHVVRWRVLWLAIALTIWPYVIYTQSVEHPSAVPDLVPALFLKESPSVFWPRLTVPPKDTPAKDFYFRAERRTELGKGFAIAWRDYAHAFRADNINKPTCVAASILLVLLLIAIGLRWRTLLASSFRLLVALSVVALLLMLLALLPRFTDEDVWMPRYLALIYPAVLLIMAVLITRQPTRWVRYATIALFIGMNLSQHAARVYADSEPPTDLIAADVIRAQNRSKVPTQPDVASFRTYTEFGGYLTPHPGGGTLFTAPGRYYLREISRSDKPANEVRAGAFEHWFDIWRQIRPDDIAKDLEAAPQVKRFVVWTGFEPFTLEQADPIADRLKGKFKRVSDQTWAVRDHWRWYNRFQLRRREYVNIDSQ